MDNFTFNKKINDLKACNDINERRKLALELIKMLAHAMPGGNATRIDLFDILDAVDPTLNPDV